ncbi:E3 ubiquitin-protein ligase Bre1-like isoform X2 [Littorina saxatilis]|uniref:E3 ubiquitin protein ligase n=1 Tax=Littorina saxatilis TaxID=31220 RepID=A0AAN9FWZ2_9CAEN
MASKRPAEESPSSSGQPPTKKPATLFEHYKMGSIYSLEELDLKVLVFQNRKLSERIEQRKKVENELRKRIEQLENRQRTDDAVLMIVNRYWNQLDEDVRVLLQRLDAETADETETKNESNETTSFLTLLSTWDKQELEQRLGQRVEFSKRAIGKLLQAFDRLLQRNEKMHQAIADRLEKQEALLESVDAAATDKEADATEGSGDKAKTEEAGENDTEKKEEGEKENGETEEKKKEEEKEKEKEKVKELEDVVKGELSDLRREARQLHNLVTQLHQQHHEHTLKISELQDKVTAAETESAELKNKVDDMDYEANKAAEKIDRLERLLTEKSQKLQYYTETGTTVTIEGGKSVTGLTRAKLDEILSDLEENRELATNRLMELEKLTADHQEALKEIEKLKMDLQHLPESVILETTEYKCLQSQFSVLYNESMQIRTQLEDSRNQLQLNKNTHLRQIEHMEIEELEGQKRLRTEMIQAEDNYAQMRKEYEMLRIEFEQAMAANDQNVTINREMRNLIQSLQNHNQQLKMESARHKRRLKETQAEMAKLRQEMATINPSAANQPGTPTTPTAFTSGASTSAGDGISSPDTKEGIAIKDEPHDPLMSPAIKKEEGEGGVKKEEDEDGEGKPRSSGDSELVKELRMQLKKSQDGARELKLLLDMYKSAPKEQRDKVQLMTAEKKARQEMEDIRQQLKKMQETERRDRRKLAEDEALRKIKKMEETIAELQKSLASQKQREEALLNDLEVTGQAFEDMQEQNLRLLQQLREKDDANFKLMSERIKSNQIQKLLKEEKDVLDEQGTQLQAQVEAQNLVVRSLEDKERIMQTSLLTIEKESSLTQQALELHKRKAVESSQTAADLKLHLDKYQAQLKEAQIAVAEKTSALDQEVFKYKRMQEEVAKLQRKLERSQKIEQAGAADEVLLEEIKEYKEQLTCPSCKVNRKDAVLVKCFHVFCLECLRTRYETRQRKCPKCNAGFGANDFHRLYLS